MIFIYVFFLSACMHRSKCNEQEDLWKPTIGEHKSISNLDRSVITNVVAGLAIETLKCLVVDLIRRMIFPGP